MYFLRNYKTKFLGSSLNNEVRIEFEPIERFHIRCFTTGASDYLVEFTESI